MSITIWFKIVHFKNSRGTAGRFLIEEIGKKIEKWQRFQIQNLKRRGGRRLQKRQKGDTSLC